MVKKVHYTWKDIEHMNQVIINLMYADNWRPDYIVGITRGGLVPASMMSNATGIKCHTLDVRFRDTDEDDSGPESNCWMAEDAFGYEEHKLRDYQTDIQASANEEIVEIPFMGKNILVLDDINDSGKTFEWIKQDWMSGCLPNDPHWDNVWHNNVRFATLIDNMGSSFQEVDYTALEIDKRDDPSWIVFPWEGERDYGNF